MPTLVLIGFCVTLLVYGVYCLHRAFQGNAPATTYHQELGEQRTYTAVDRNGDFIEYVHPDFVRILLCCVAIVMLIIGRLTH
jgi:hypothetical protein